MNARIWWKYFLVMEELVTVDIMYFTTLTAQKSHAKNRGVLSMILQDTRARALFWLFLRCAPNCALEKIC